jgi:thiol-disulfide isomerase/thioredoxin
VKRIHNSKEVKRLLSEEGPLMVIIYADWCGHCQESEQEWTKLANRVDGKATVYAIESSEYEEDDINGYPTMKIVKDGKLMEYSGSRHAPHMEKALLGRAALLGGKRARRSGTRRLRNRRRKTHRALR